MSCPAQRLPDPEMERSPRRLSAAAFTKRWKLNPGHAHRDWVWLLPGLPYASSYTRRPAILELYATFCRRRGGTFAPGRLWSSCDNISRHGRFLPKEFKRHPDSRQAMMSPTGHDVWEALPDQITIYRGCYGTTNSDCAGVWIEEEPPNCRP